MAIAGALLIGVLLTPTAAIAQGDEALSNEDVVRMATAGLHSTIIKSTVESAVSVRFDLSPSALIELRKSGVNDYVIQAMIEKRQRSEASKVQKDAPEKSDRLATSKDGDWILRNFKTMWVDASNAEFFDSSQMKAALGENKDFRMLDVVMVDDRSVADVVLEVSYTFAWDYPFVLKHQNSTVVLVSGKGTGPFSGPAGAKSVASHLAKALKTYRLPPPAPKGK
jgi:hypothetical protein